MNVTPTNGRRALGMNKRGLLKNLLADSPKMITMIRFLMARKAGGGYSRRDAACLEVCLTNRARASELEVPFQAPRGTPFCTPAPLRPLYQTALNG